LCAHKLDLNSLQCEFSYAFDNNGGSARYAKAVFPDREITRLKCKYAYSDNEFKLLPLKMVQLSKVVKHLVSFFVNVHGQSKLCVTVVLPASILIC